MITRFTHWIVKRTIPDHQNVNHVTVRARYGMLEAWTSIVVNLLLFVAKGLIGWSMASVAVLADAFHTLSDSGTSIVILIGFGVARLPADRRHPFGHGRMEAIATLIVAVLLVVTGFELLSSAVRRIAHPTVVAAQINTFGIVILIVTIVIKEITARFARELGRMIDSRALHADFWHHRSDVLTTILVLVALFAARAGYHRVDGIAGLVVALTIIVSGLAIARETVNSLMGEAPTPEMITDIEKAALSLDGVQGVHDVIVHHYGQLNMASLHIEVLDTESAATLHTLSEQVEEVVQEKIAGAAVVHIDPLNREHERYQELEDVVAAEVTRTDRVLSFHDLRLFGHGARIRAAFDAVLEEGLNQAERDAVKWQLRNQLTERMPTIRWSIKTEPSYGYPTSPS